MMPAPSVGRQPAAVRRQSEQFTFPERGLLGNARSLKILRGIFGGSGLHPYLDMVRIYLLTIVDICEVA